MITGEFQYSLDEKGRIMLPVKVRAEIEGNILILTRGVDQCIWLFPPQEWSKISSNVLDSTSIFQEKARLIQRRIIAPAQEVELDKTGRLIIPTTLREYAGLKKECVILGMLKYIEIWDMEIYEKYWSSNEDKFQEAAEELGGKIGL